MSTKHTIALILALFLSFSVLGGVAEAAKGGGHNTTATGGSASLVLLNSTDGLAHWGQQVTFTVTTTATSRPFVLLQCYQGGARVYSMSAGFFADYPFTTTYKLSSSYWTGGAADCTATVYYFASNGKETVLGTSSIHIEG